MKQAIQWLKREKNMLQKDIAVQMEMSEVSFSRGMERVKIKNDERFILDGYNLRTNLYLTPWEAALSTKVTINGINEDVSIYVPAGIQSGEKIEIEDRGYKDGKGGRGKLILDTKIMIPKRPNEKELELFKQFSEMSKFNPRNS